MMSGIFFNKRIYVRVKGKVYKTIVRPTTLYWAETWPIKKTHEKKDIKVDVGTSG